MARFEASQGIFVDHRLRYDDPPARGIRAPHFHPNPFRLFPDRPQASVAIVIAQIFEQSATIEQIGRTVIEAQAALDFLMQQNARFKDLVVKGAGTTQRAEQSTSDLESKRAALWAGKFGQSGAERQTLVLDAQRKNAEAQLAEAKAQKATADADLSRTELHATTEGRIPGSLPHGVNSPRRGKA
jgi:multidrug resistance efflux pump